MRTIVFVTLAALAMGCGGSPDVQASDQELATAPMENFHKVRAGLYRGGHPDTSGIAFLKKIGVRTIVDLEVADWIEAFPWDIDQELSDAKSAGITVLRYPMSAFEPAISSEFDHNMDDILKKLEDTSLEPIYVHCKHGQDRTGLVIGLERVKDESWTPQNAFNEMLKDGFHTFFIGLDEYFEQKSGWHD
jgi:protein tyrosine/serine phosphatase